MTGPLNPLMERAKLCYCLGFIPKNVFNLITYIANIRNLAAHSGSEVTFGSPELQGVITKFVNMYDLVMAKLENIE